MNGGGSHPRLAGLLHAWRGAAGLLACLLIAGAAQAQQGVDSANSLLRCLVKPSKAELEKLEAPGADVAVSVVRVRLSFESAAAPPRVAVLFDSAGDARRNAVRDYVAGYRLPCMPAGSAEVVGQQEFSFKPFRDSTVRESYERLEALHACITGLDDLPGYPYSAISTVADGRVFGSATFSGPNRPPDVRILYDGGERRFAKVTSAYLAALRITCGDAVEFPITVSRTFTYSLEGDTHMVLKDLSLPTFLAALDRPERTHPFFDFASMGCPFDVRFELREPFLENQVQQIGSRDPNRREFLEWLKTTSFKIPESKARPLIGEAMKLNVPCLVLDLR